MLSFMLLLFIFVIQYFIALFAIFFVLYQQLMLKISLMVIIHDLFFYLMAHELISSLSYAFC